ncbi:MAG: hemerythrin domain-containing protein [Pseudomonadota bacterium]|nr:hemerythrin domain-containing protein [Pseudomonadota bacterium]
MATRTPSRSASTTRTRSTSGAKASSGSRNSNGASSKAGTTNSKPRSGGSSKEEPSAFAFGERNGNNTGALVTAALAGAAIGFAANYGRKFLMQGLEATAGDWDAILATEHDAALALFDKMLATDETQTFKRKMLLMKLTHALDKHAHQEEMVVYPALREAGIRVEADQLEVEHGQVKTYLYELGQMSADAPNWLEKVREFRGIISRHVHMEEEEVFPAFKKDLSEQQNSRITSMVNRDGFWMA